MPDFLPSTDAGIRAFGLNYSTRITANPTSFGLTAAIATTLADKFSAFDVALAAATDPGTRGSATVLAKDTARADLVSYIRQTARAIQGTLTVTDQQRHDLGLNVRKPRSPIGVPEHPPVLEVVQRAGTWVQLRLHDAQGDHRGKPAGVAGAAIFSYVGATPPANVDDWDFQGNVTKPLVDIVFPPELPAGTVVYFTAFWFNPRTQSGPGCAPVQAILAGGQMQATA